MFFSEMCDQIAKENGKARKMVSLHGLKINKNLQPHSRSRTYAQACIHKHTPKIYTHTGRKREREEWCENWKEREGIS